MFKILSLLLMYPEQNLVDELDELVQVIEQEKWFDAKQNAIFQPFIQYLKAHPLIDLQEKYVSTFDRIPSLSLHIFEHIHGDSRDRGQAMVDLIDLYQAHGLFVESNELPDFIPLFLEYLSILPLTEAADTLGETINVMAAIKGRLTARQSPYAAIFELIHFYSAKNPDEKIVRESLKKKDKKEDSQEAIDKRWVEQPAFKPIKIKEKQGGELS